MKWNKVTVGFVMQTYEDEICVAQEFIAEDQVDYEDYEYGDPIDPPCNEQYFPFDMIQPDSPDTTL